MIWGDWDQLRSSAMSTFDTVHTTSHSPFMEMMRLSCTTFETWWVICQKSQFFPTPHVLVPPVGMTPLEFHHNLWHQKTRLSGVPCKYHKTTLSGLSGKYQNKNSSGDEIANVNFFYNIAHVEASAYAH